LRLNGYGLEIGKKADLNVLCAPSVQHVFRLQQPPAYVIKSGRILANSLLVREIYHA